MFAEPCRSNSLRRMTPAKLALAAALAVLPLGRSAEAGQVDLTTAHLSDLLVPGNFAIVGNERFDSFTWAVTTSGGAVTPDPANIKVSAINGPAGLGLMFQSGPFLTVGNQTLDARLGFDVTTLDLNKKITMAELSYTAGTTGGGSASISEIVRDPANNQLGQQLVIEQQNLPNGGKSFATMTFAPQTTIQVAKDIQLIGTAFVTPAEINAAQMSDFSQIFGPAVPEPSGIALAAVASGGVGWFGWRRRKRKSRSRGALRLREPKPQKGSV